MRKLMKQIWGIILVLIITFTSTGVDVFATELTEEVIESCETEEEQDLEDESLASALPVSGKIENDTDEGITWKIDSNGNLTISGKGEINTDTKYLMTTDKIPWYTYRTSIKKADINLAEITDVGSLLKGCENLIEVDVTDFDTSDVVWMGAMFSGCSSITSLDLNNFDTSNVTSMGSMFFGCSSIKNLNLNNFNTSSVTNMGAMFRDCTSLENLEISNFNTENVTDMFYMFGNCVSLKSINVSNFDTSQVTDMNDMFYNCKSLTSIDISNFDTSNVKVIADLFWGCENVTELKLGKMEVQNVDNMSGMFAHCKKIETLDLSDFDTSNVTQMYSMFYGCTNLKSIDISNFDTGKVEQIWAMFKECENLETLDLSNFDMSVTEGTSYMLDGCNKLISINAPYNILSGQSILLPSEEGYAWYTSDFTETTILPEGIEESVLLTKYSTEYVEENKKYGTIEIGNGNVYWEINLAGKLTVTGEGEIFSPDDEIEDDEMCYAESLPWYEYRGLIEKADINLKGITNIRSFFYDCYNLTTVDVSEFDTSQVKDMSSMFAYCENLETVQFVAGGTENKFITSNVENMSYMFAECKGLEEIDLSNFDTSNVTDMSGMFSGCDNVMELDLSNFSTDKVTNMQGMFETCSSLETLVIDNFNTCNVTNMWALFAECSSIQSLDVSNFNTSKVTDMDGMFGDCSSLETLDLSNFNMCNVLSAVDMLSGCDNLVEVEAPINVTETCVIELPSEEEYVWYISEIGIVTTIPAKLSKSITITKRNAIDFVTPTYTVEFNCMGGSGVETQYIEEEGLVIKPETPHKEGYTLCGWSKDDSFTEDWDFATDTVQGDITLYARWKENVWDKKPANTGICVEIIDMDSYIYDGKAIRPRINVWDDNKVLREGVDYKVTYKNNVNACNHDDVLIKDNKKPQIIIQGIGEYKSSFKLTEFFSIQQADIEDLEIVVSSRISTKSNNKLQKISPIIKTDKVKVPAKNYKISYFSDAELTNELKGITTPGTYYITIEAKKNADDIYVGNYQGISEPIEVVAIKAEELLDKAKITIGKKLEVNPTEKNADVAIGVIFAQLKIGKDTYKTLSDNLNTWKKYFEVSAIDCDGSEISQENFYKVINSTGIKYVTVRAKEGNDKRYTGEQTIKITVSGKKLKKEMFKLSYASEYDKTVNKTDYTAHSMIPKIYTDLKEGQDYQVTYKLGKNVICPNDIINVGTYTAVINGINQYSGTVSLKFSICKVNLATAYQNKKLTIVNDGKVVEHCLTGANKEVLVYYDADGNGDLYDEIELTNTDYKTSYYNNKKASSSGKSAYLSLGGKGNFTGTLKGDGKADNSDVKKGIAKELNYIVGLKDFASEDIQILVKGFVIKKSKIIGVKFEVYDSGKKVSVAEYSSLVKEIDDNVQLSITGKGKSYIGSKAIIMNNNLIKATDSKNVRISYKESKNYYYNGKTHRPEIIIRDKDGNDITDCFEIEYGENIKVGNGLITIKGKLVNGYCDQKVLKFPILPKWMQWLFR